MTVERAIADYLDDHVGAITVKKHWSGIVPLSACSKGTCKRDEISPWLARLMLPILPPGFRLYAKRQADMEKCAVNARSRPIRVPRAFFHWLVRQQIIAENPFERVDLPTVGKPLTKTMSNEEFEQLLLACAPPHEEGRFAERAAVCNRAILWLFYDSGIRLSELINLRVGDFDRKHGLITVKGKGSKERCIALGQICLRNPWNARGLLQMREKKQPFFIGVA